jgi:hypothetical protein
LREAAWIRRRSFLRDLLGAAKTPTPATRLCSEDIAQLARPVRDHSVAQRILAKELQI